MCFVVIYMCGCACGGHVHLCVCGGKDQGPSLPQLLSISYFETGFSLNLESTSLARLDSESQVPLFQYWVYKHVLPCLSLSVGARDLNSGPQGCVGVLYFLNHLLGLICSFLEGTLIRSMKGTQPELTIMCGRAKGGWHVSKWVGPE